MAFSIMEEFRKTQYQENQVDFWQSSLRSNVLNLKKIYLSGCYMCLLIENGLKTQLCYNCAIGVF